MLYYVGVSKPSRETQIAVKHFYSILSKSQTVLAWVKTSSSSSPSLHYQCFNLHLEQSDLKAHSSNYFPLHWVVFCWDLESWEILTYRLKDNDSAVIVVTP